ncbi:MAG: hypothetical protein IK076_04780 [Bacteroidales bacterium]|nr:hypothetical protein [Bacteroidales bacterium]
MNFKKNKFYRDGFFHHLYVKSINGNVLFYRTEDYLFLYTLFSVLSFKHKIIVESFCIMFNHFHGSVKASSYEVFKAFCRDLLSILTIQYNNEYNLSGKLLMECGYAPKTSGKKHRSCLVYIANNPVAGRLVSSAMEYKWNVLAYFRSNHPFSEKLVKRNCRFAMRRALARVDGFRKREQYLNYRALESIFNKLTAEEKAQMTDYIITKYNFIDKTSFVSNFGDFKKAMTAVESMAGSEDDFHEPWEDYSVYYSMLKATKNSGLDCKRFRFQEMSAREFRRLYNKLSTLPGVTKKHLHRFLHIYSGNDDASSVAVASTTNHQCKTP